ncbi:MAG: hypothetical protein CCU26_18050 [Nitrospira sp. UW-LDO-01]|nr:MAG: hypothetical protein CCU26_18050 [Nitrospira sp. UW-LDO-01]
MKHLLTFTKTCWAVILVAAIGLATYGCSDSVSISEQTVEVPLSSLTVTPGTIQPAFSSNTTTYLVEVSTTVPTVTVTATPKDSSTTMSINGVDTISGQGRTITLNSSATTTSITIVLTSQNGLESTYDILVRKVDNTLSALTVTPPGTFPPPGFNPNTLTYQVEVASGVSSVAVVATKTDVHAVMSGSVTAAAGVATGKATIRLNGPGLPTEVTITVAVPNGEAKTYTVTVNRLSGDNTLSNLRAIDTDTSSPQLLSPAFRPEYSGPYTVEFPTNVTSVTVIATKSDQNAAMTGHIIAGVGILEGAITLDLGPAGPEVNIDLLITVAAPDPTIDPKDYQVKVKRPALSGNANLSALNVKVGDTDQPLSPTFAANTPDYVVSVAAAVEEVTVSATKEDPDAVLNIAGVPVPAGTNTGTRFNFPLLGAGNDTPVVPITVTAPDGTVKNPPYTLTVRRAAHAAPPPPVSAPDMMDTSDSGTINTDNITSIGTPSFVVPQPAAGETPSIYINESKVLDATFDPLTNTFTLVSPLTDGPHTITSTVTNTMTTLESLQSPPLPIIIDPAAP